MRTSASYEKEEALYADSEGDSQTVPLKKCRLCGHALCGHNHDKGICFVCQEKGRNADEIESVVTADVDETKYSESVLMAVCEEYGISLGVLRDSWGTRNTIEARHVTVWILYQHGRLSKQEISKLTHVGNRTGTGANYAIKRIEQRIKENPALVERVRKILETCGPPPDENA